MISIRWRNKNLSAKVSPDPSSSIHREVTNVILDAGGLYIVRRLAIDFDEFNDRVHQEHVDNDRSLALDLIRLGVEEIILVTNDTTEHPRNDGKIVFVKPYKSPADIIDGRIGFYNQQSGFYDLDLATASWYQLNAAAQHELERYQQSALTDFSNGQSSLDIQDLVTWAIPSIKYAEMVQE